MAANQFTLSAKIWRYPGKGGWRFVSIPKDISEEIRRRFGDLERGWGSLQVSATVGQTAWETSIFMDTKSGAYLLPLKASVGKKENIAVDQTIRLILKINV